MSLRFTPLYLLVFATLFSCNQTKSNRPPNVILIMVDDMGVEALNCYGNTQNKTPHIDAMAANSILFNDCVSQPLCTPSRLKIMTGKYNYRNYEHFGYLNTNQHTFGNLFKEQNYSTCIAGKWQLNGLSYKDEITDWNKSSRPVNFGFDEYCLWQLTKTSAEGGRYANPLIEQNGKILPQDPEAYGPDIFSNFVLDFIEKNKEKPFFVYYPMVLVHDPFVPTPDSKDWNDETKRFKNDTTYFKDMVAYTDKIVGKIQSKIKELNLEEDTIVIFTADNGTHPTVFSPTKNGIVQGAKGNTITAGTHVPLIVNWGSKTKTLKYDGLIEFSDFYTTFADLLGNENVKPDGKSFLDVLNKNSKENIRETALVYYDPEWGANVSQYRNMFVRTKHYKLYQDGKFYNLDNDILEKHPLHADSLSNHEIEIKKMLEQEFSKHPKFK
ncbi:sulfatase-like hydrolase/transferase [Aestuariibaculum sediminum]|uniref:Sulfatase-like hydrolase/transferase n=1 Tax=Aestuariibaculum sediminum TaxID=2770637 RepID=A0A8J6Q425_9FLAO|nr:sulfatase-like hydrolase/transferase [Aestuariibaculum sediminum]MBD0833005.1 sulfatase-like hydrolase/transferase [Aestuariibaculum sediminum]